MFLQLLLYFRLISPALRGATCPKSRLPAPLFPTLFRTLPHTPCWNLCPTTARSNVLSLSEAQHKPIVIFDPSSTWSGPNSSFTWMSGWDPTCPDWTRHVYYDASWVQIAGQGSERKPWDAWKAQSEAGVLGQRVTLRCPRRIPASVKILEPSQTWHTYSGNSMCEERGDGNHAARASKKSTKADREPADGNAICEHLVRTFGYIWVLANRLQAEVGQGIFASDTCILQLDGKQVSFMPTTCSKRYNRMAEVHAEATECEMKNKCLAASLEVWVEAWKAVDWKAVFTVCRGRKKASAAKRVGRAAPVPVSN